MQRIGGDILIAALLFVLLVLYSLPSLALQPVETFIAGARQRNPDALEARANLSQQEAQADSALGRVLPGVTARGSYTRNQYGSQIDLAQPGQPPQPVTLVPRDQWDGSATLKVPLIDLAGFRRVSAAKTSAQASAHQLDATGLQVEGQAAQVYYQVVANLALVTASRTALDVSREGLRLAQARYQAGTAAALEVDRARAALQQADAQRLALAPSIAGTFTEHGTNAPGFTGHDWSYQAALTLTWSLDLTSFADIRAQDAAADAAGARELRALLSAGDAIHREWNTVVAGIARSRSARAGREAATHAASQARERYRAGTITQLDLLQAQRDAFSAEVSRIQADADLVNARAQLRLSSGQSLLADRTKGTP